MHRTKELSAALFEENIIGGWDAWRDLHQDESRAVLNAALEMLILPWGQHLMMGSPRYLIDKIVSIEQKEKGTLLLGGKDVSQPDADGVYITPCNIRPYQSDDGSLDFLLIDNRLTDQDAFSSRHERVEYEGNRRYVCLNSQPLLIFPYCSAMVHPRVRAAAIDEWKKQERAAAKP